jgi:hypothetical protein
MTPTEPRGYLAHHLKLVSRDDQMFPDDAAALIHHTSRGLPRAINDLGLQATRTRPSSMNPPHEQPSPKSPPNDPKRSRRHAAQHTATPHI